MKIWSYYRKVYELHPQDIALRFMAIAATCYTCFFRISECLQLKFKNIRFITDLSGLQQMTIQIDHRKNNPKPFTYRIINFPTEPACNSYFFMHSYFEYLEKFGPVIDPEEYVFGHVYKGTLKYDKKHQSNQVFDAFLKQLIKEIGLDKSVYSTHTFRKGGARHRHLYAAATWNLDTIIRWASWSYNVDNKVLITYLQDEARAKEDDRLEYAMK